MPSMPLWERIGRTNYPVLGAAGLGVGLGLAASGEAKRTVVAWWNAADDVVRHGFASHKATVAAAAKKTDVERQAAAKKAAQEKAQAEEVAFERQKAVAEAGRSVFEAPVYQAPTFQAPTFVNAPTFQAPTFPNAFEPSAERGEGGATTPTNPLASLTDAQLAKALTDHYVGNALIPNPPGFHAYESELGRRGIDINNSRALYALAATYPGTTTTARVDQTLDRMRRGLRTVLAWAGVTDDEIAELAGKDLGWHLVNIGGYEIPIPTEAHLAEASGDVVGLVAKHVAVGLTVDVPIAATAAVLGFFERVVLNRPGFYSQFVNGLERFRQDLDSLLLHGNLPSSSSTPSATYAYWTDRRVPNPFGEDWEFQSGDERHVQEITVAEFRYAAWKRRNPFWRWPFPPGHLGPEWGLPPEGYGGANVPLVVG